MAEISPKLIDTKTSKRGWLDPASLETRTYLIPEGYEFCPYIVTKPFELRVEKYGNFTPEVCIHKIPWDNTTEWVSLTREDGSFETIVRHSVNAVVEWENRIGEHQTRQFVAIDPKAYGMPLREIARKSRNRCPDRGGFNIGTDAREARFAFLRFAEDNIVGWYDLSFKDRDKALEVYRDCLYGDFPNNNEYTHDGREKDLDSFMEANRGYATARRMYWNNKENKYKVILADVSKYPYVKKFEDAGFRIFCASGIEAKAQIRTEQEHKYQEEIRNRDAYDKSGWEEYRNVKKWVFVTWSGNWADEIDLSSSCLMPQKEFKKFQKDLKSAGDIIVDVGTNEEIETTGEEYLEGCTSVEVKDKKIVEFLLENLPTNETWNPLDVWNDIKEKNDGDANND